MASYEMFGYVQEQAFKVKSDINESKHVENADTDSDNNTNTNGFSHSPFFGKVKFKAIALLVSW